MTEVSSGEEPARTAPTADVTGAMRAALHSPRAITAIVVVFALGGFLATRFLARSTAPRADGEQLVPAAATISVKKANPNFGSASKQVLELESVLGASGSEVSTPQERGYRVLLPSQRARSLASAIPDDAPAFARSLKAIADSQFIEGRKLLEQAVREEPGAAWRTELAASVLEVYAGRYDEAIRQARAAVQLRPDDPACLNQAGVALLDAGRFAEAANMVEKAIRIQENAGSTASLMFADSLEILATSLAAQRQSAEATTNYKRAMAIRTKLVGAEAPANARILARLATLCEARGRFADAKPLYRRALDLVRKHYGNGGPETAVCLNNLAGLYAEQRQFSRAEPLFREALDIQVKTLGEQSLETGQTLNNLAGLYAEKGLTHQAEELFARVLRNQMNTAGSETPDAAQTMDNLANLYSREGRYEEADRLYTRELEIREKTLGKVHADTATTLNNIACLYTQMGRWKQADTLFRRSIEVCARLNSSASPEALNAYGNYAVLLRKQGRLTEARSYEMRLRGDRAAAHR